MKRGVDYFRASFGTVYKMKRIAVAVDPGNGPWLVRDFIRFEEHGKVSVDMATCGGTPEIEQFKFWRFPTLTCAATVLDKCLPVGSKMIKASELI